MSRLILFLAFVAFGFSGPTTNAAVLTKGRLTTPVNTPSATACACPFCSALTLTFSEQMNSSDIVVVAELIEVPPPSTDPDADFPKAEFEISGVLKGKDFVKEGMHFKTQLVGPFPKGQRFLVMGTDPPNVGWSTPMKASERVFKYLRDVQALPEKGPKRLAFFQGYFEDKESVLAFDAYDEFARAPYEDMIAMKDQMNHDQLINWIKDPETSVNNRRLYFTMLGICGSEKDTEFLEELISSDSRKKRAGLDALIACYLMLKGESGVDLIEKRFLIDTEVDYVDTLAAVSALRFHGTEVKLVPKKRIVAAIRHLLDRPKMADMIIPDLARWEDWSVMERLVQMFKDADTDSNWLRVPVITYLRACPKPEAKKYIEELRKLDPESVQRADFFLGFEDDDDWGDDESDEDPTEDQKDDSSDSPAKESEAEKDKTPGKSDKIQFVSFQTPAIETDPVGTFAIEMDGPETDPTLGESSATHTSSRNASPIPSTTANPIPMNSDRKVFVSNTADPIVSPAEARNSTSTQPQQLSTASTPLVAATARPNLTWMIILIPMATSGLIFLLLWSVVNGWFERLIF